MINQKDDELDFLINWIEAMIDLKIERAFGRDTLHEGIQESELRQKLYSIRGKKNETI